MTPLDTNAYVTAWIPLRPVAGDERDSGMAFAAGSHRDFALPFWHDLKEAGDLGARGYRIEGTGERGRTRPCRCFARDVGGPVRWCCEALQSQKRGVAWWRGKVRATPAATLASAFALCPPVATPQARWRSATSRGTTGGRCTARARSRRAASRGWPSRPATTQTARGCWMSTATPPSGMPPYAAHAPPARRTAPAARPGMLRVSRGHGSGICLGKQPRQPEPSYALCADVVCPRPHPLWPPPGARCCTTRTQRATGRGPRNSRAVRPRGTRCCRSCGTAAGLCRCNQLAYKPRGGVWACQHFMPQGRRRVRYTAAFLWCGAGPTCSTDE